MYSFTHVRVDVNVCFTQWVIICYYHYFDAQLSQAWPFQTGSCILLTVLHYLNTSLFSGVTKCCRHGLLLNFIASVLELAISPGILDSFQRTAELLSAL